MSDAGISGLTPDGRDLDGGVGRAADAERAYRIIKGVNAQCGTTVTYRSREPFVISAVTLVLFAGWMVGLVVTAAQAGKAAQGVAIVVLGPSRSSGCSSGR